MIQKLGKKILAISIVATCALSSALACTDFRVTAKDGTVLIARSMEYAADLKSNLRTSTRGRMFNMTAPDGGQGLTWKAKYGYVFLDAMNKDFVIDGMNEKGLSFEALYLPMLAEYQSVPVPQGTHALPYMNLGDWVLSNFDSVDQVRQELKNIYVYNKKIPGMGNMMFPLHFSIYDTTGKGIVVEYIKGRLHIYNNKIGVLTNSPSYGWHITNLNNYTNLMPKNPKPVMDSGITFAASGQGYGMIGMPGDISPTSRFIKVATLTRVAMPATNAVGALNLAEHIINNVDIPRGLAREPNNGNYSSELTQWVVFKDLSNRVFYYRTYEDLSLHAVDLTRLDFSETAKRLKMPIGSSEFVLDMSDDFLKATSA